MIRTLLYIFFISYSFGQTIDVSTIEPMMSFIIELKSEEKVTQSLKDKLHRILDMKSYQYMFEHYNRDWRPDHLPSTVFANMILSLKEHAYYTTGSNRRADQMYPFWKSIYLNPDSMRTVIDKFKSIDFKAMMKRSNDLAATYLPNRELPKYHVFFHLNGGSNGFAFRSKDGTLFQGHDLLQFEADDFRTIEIKNLSRTLSLMKSIILG